MTSHRDLIPPAHVIEAFYGTMAGVFFFYFGLFCSFLLIAACNTIEKKMNKFFKHRAENSESVPFLLATNTHDYSKDDTVARKTRTRNNRSLSIATAAMLNANGSTKTCKLSSVKQPKIQIGVMQMKRRGEGGAAYGDIT